jgi:C-terminal processing protease CtpA/Prc
LIKRGALGLFLLGGLGCGADTSGSSAGACSTPGEVQFVRTTLRDIYFWYQQLPDPDPVGFASPEAYLDAVRYKPIDTSYSYITNKAASDAFFSDSQFIGIGLATHQTSASTLRVTEVFPDSPASEAGLGRGDYLLSINGKGVPDLIRTGEINTIFGPSQIGVVVDLTWRRLLGGEASATLTKRAVTIPTVSRTQVYDQSRGTRVGYVVFRNFVRPSTGALDTAFTELSAAGAGELILDLRYNGGGLLSVAQHLSSLIGGTVTNGQVFVELFHNDKNASRNKTLAYDDPPSALSLSRLIVIATRATASASESVINGLRPFIPVTVVGNTTFGKPVGQYGYDFCDKTLFPVAFEVRNARGQGDYFNGIPADCAASDDLDHAIGDEGEASLAEALHYIRSGTCSATAASTAHALARREADLGRGLPTDGWRQLVNAY